ncbi:phage tail fiber protein [Thermocrinis sp.]|jgi:hypothetical protein|uniref:phage tail fiber protein n=1 Tax=Thermocrinis sp. TaxID=2024383 RepID=UPI003C0290D6
MATEITEAYAQAVASNIIQNSYVGLIRQDGSECPVGRVAFGIVVVDATTNSDYIVLSNLNDITFPIASTDVAPISNPVVQVALYDASSGGNLLAKTDIVAKPYLAGDQFKIPSGWLQFRIQKVVP